MALLGYCWGVTFVRNFKRAENLKFETKSARIGVGLALPLEFLHFGLTAKYQLTTALARLRERGDREAVGEGVVDCAPRKQPLTPGFAGPSPLGEGRYQLRCQVNPNVENSRGRACPTLSK